MASAKQRISHHKCPSNKTLLIQGVHYSDSLREDDIRKFGRHILLLPIQLDVITIEHNQSWQGRGMHGQTRKSTKENLR